MCVDCMQNCTMCNNTDSCLECDAGLVFLQGSENGDLCLESCPDGYFEDKNGNCQECSAGCSSCSSADSCDTCNAYTSLQDGECQCEFNYDVKARPTYHYIQVDLYNLIW